MDLNGKYLELIVWLEIVPGIDALFFCSLKRMRGGEMPKRSSQCTNFISDNKNDDFKYSKDYMLSLYKTVDLPNDIQHQEYPVTVQDQSPLSLLEKEVNKKTKKKVFTGTFFSCL